MMMSNDAFREELAAYAHDAWCRYMNHMFGKCVRQGVAILIPGDYAQSLKRLAAIPYENLSEQEKESDREEADKILSMIFASLLNTFDPHDSIDL
jgi:hypothetical protein